MIKKILLSLVCCIALVSSLCVSVFADSYTEGEGSGNSGGSFADYDETGSGHSSGNFTANAYEYQLIYNKRLLNGEITIEEYHEAMFSENSPVMKLSMDKVKAMYGFPSDSTLSLDDFIALGVDGIVKTSTNYIRNDITNNGGTTHVFNNPYHIYSLEDGSYLTYQAVNPHKDDYLWADQTIFDIVISYYSVNGSLVETKTFTGWYTSWDGSYAFDEPNVHWSESGSYYGIHFSWYGGLTTYRDSINYQRIDLSLGWHPSTIEGSETESTTTDVDNLTNEELLELLDKMIETFQDSYPDLSTMEGLLKSILNELKKGDGCECPPLLNMINSSIIELSKKVGQQPDLSEITGLLGEIKEEIKNNSSESDTIDYTEQLKELTDNLDTVVNKLGVIEGLLAFDVAADIFDELTDEESKYLDSLADVALTLANLLPSATIQSVILDLQSYFYSDVMPADLYVKYKDKEILFLSASMFGSSEWTNALEVVKIFVSFLLCYAWLISMRRKVSDIFGG